MAKCSSEYFSCVIIIISLVLREISAICTPDTVQGHVNDAAEVAALSKIAVLQGEIWEWNSYVLGICPSEILKHTAAGVVQKTSKGDLVLGRTNRTHATSGSSWVLLVYRGGDLSTTLICAGNFTAEILIICDSQQSQKGKAHLIEQDACVARFELATSVLCPLEGPSAVSLILIWSIFLLTLYCLIGIVYRRFKLRVRGCQQLPHLPFWSKIGRTCADCCNWACRCEEEATETWDADTDRDDVLLRP